MQLVLKNMLLKETALSSENEHKIQDESCFWVGSEGKQRVSIY